jgi:hypothetical protein
MGQMDFADGADGLFGLAAFFCRCRAGQHHADWQPVRDVLSGMCYIVFFYVLIVSDSKKKVIEDERDRSIAAVANHIGLWTMTLTVLVSAAVIGMDAYAFLLARMSGGWSLQ